MTNKPEQPSKLPEFANRQEAAEWFDTHDVGDYLEEFEIVDRNQVQVNKNLSVNLTVRLTPDLLNRLKHQAEGIGVGPSTLARMWILERLREPNQHTIKTS